RHHVDAWHQDGEQPAEPGDLSQVRGERPGRSGVLDLDGHLAAVTPYGVVDLSDRGRERRMVVELGELVAPVAAERSGEYAVDRGNAHRRGRVLELGERLAVRRCELV